MLSLYLALQAALLFAISDSESITDTQLVGTWEPSGETYAPPHGSGTITYRANHTCTEKSYGEDGASFAHGIWRLHGRELTVRYGDLEVHETVLSVSPNQFKTRFTIDGKDALFIYTRVTQEHLKHLTRRCSERLPVVRTKF